MSAYLQMTGPAYDLEATYLKHPTKTLPDPPGYPFHMQGMPIYFDQPHIGPTEIVVATGATKTNPLPFGHFIGVGVNGAAPKQINQPDFLSINEDIYFQ